MHTEGRESELLIALAQTRNELARERDRSGGLKASKDNLSRMYGEQCAEVKRLRERDDTARAMLSQLRAALDDDTTFLGAVLRVEMDKWLAGGGDRG